MDAVHNQSLQMSDPEIIEAEDNCSTCNSAAADTNVLTDQDLQQEVDAQRAMTDTLVQVQELVNELHAFHRLHVEEIGWLNRALPGHLTERMKEFLSKEGLKQLPSRERQGARLKIVGAIGFCLENARRVEFIDKDLVGEGELSSSEVEALYRRRLESSTPYDELRVNIPANESEKWESESWRLLADILLGAKSLDELYIRHVTLSGQFQVAKAVAASGHGPPYLKHLNIQLRPLADEAIADLMGEAIASHQSLLTLRISVRHDQDGLRMTVGGVTSGESGMGSVGRLLSRAFLDGNLRNTSINTLVLDCNFVRGEPVMVDLAVLSQVLQTAVNVTQLHLEGLGKIQSCDLWRFFRNVLDNGAPHLHSFSLHQTISMSGLGIDVGSYAMVAELLESKSMRALKHFSVQFANDDQEFDWAGFYTSLKISQLESVSLHGHLGYLQVEKTILEWIRSSKTLQKLMFCPRDEDMNWRSFFSCLKENTCLKGLTIDYGALEDDDAHRELMEVLQVNSTLQEVNWTGWLREEDSLKEAAVREALKAKARQESYLAELREGLGHAEWQRPKCGRVFLCGSPEAGKTLLASTMRKVVKRKTLMQRLVEKLRGRTEGVEIHTLSKDKDMLILLWDLAGHDIFRALQQFLFPRLTRACVFIFVFSPFLASGEKQLKPKLQDAFEQELLEWLRFIVSNSAVSGINRPQLMIVISHQDMYKSAEIDLEWCDMVLRRLISDFEDVLHIQSTPHFIDGHERKHVKPIVDEVFRVFDEQFKRRLFKVPSACYHLSQQLVLWKSQNPTEPIIDEETFFSLCGEISDLRPFSDRCRDNDHDSKTLLKAVRSYLHEFGTVIDMTCEDEIMDKPAKPKSNLIVVNPNWLTNVFLGRFIGLGHGFQLSPEEEVDWAKGSVDGFMCQTDFKQLLLKRLESMKKQFPKLTWETARDLMEHLDLLYVTQVVDEKGHSDSRFFIPTFFKWKSEETLHWNQNTCQEKTGPAGEICYLGVRLCCKDSNKTYLSNAFFCRFQVMIWRKFKEEQKSNNAVINCEFNLISVMVDGFDILIENDEGGDIIDVLIRSAKSRAIVWNFTERYIVKELRDFCASSRGCPGVELVMYHQDRVCGTFDSV